MDSDIKQESAYNHDFESHVSPLDPNMSSVARYSPIYTNSNSFTNPVVVTRLVPNGSNDGNFVCNLSNAEATLSAELGSSDIRQVVNSRFLQMVNETDLVQSDTSSALPIVSDNEHEVELLITDQATGNQNAVFLRNTITNSNFSGISYSVNTQQYLVEHCLTDNQLLETLTPDPLLESDLLALDENTLKTQLSEIALNSSESIEAQDESDLSKDMLVKFSHSNVTMDFDNNILRRSQRQQSFTDSLDTEEQLCMMENLILGLLNAF